MKQKQESKLFLLFFASSFSPNPTPRKPNKMAPSSRRFLKSAGLAVLLCASAMLLTMSSSTTNSFARAATSKRAKRAKAEAAAAAAPSAADTVLSALNVKTLLANEPNARLTELGDLSDSEATRTRVYLSPAHQKAAALIKKWMMGAGLEVTTDAVGNVRGRINGNGTLSSSATSSSSLGKKGKSTKSKTPKRWITGSHFDVVPEGGESFLFEGRRKRKEKARERERGEENK